MCGLPADKYFTVKPYLFFATALSSYGGGKRETWRVEAEGEHRTCVVHQADVSITAPDSKITFHCEITIIINRWQSPPVCKSSTLIPLKNTVYSKCGRSFWMIRHLHEYQGLLLISTKDPWALTHLLIVCPAEAFDCGGRVSELCLWMTAEDDMSWQA